LSAVLGKRYRTLSPVKGNWVGIDDEREGARPEFVSGLFVPPPPPVIPLPAPERSRAVLLTGYHTPIIALLLCATGEATNPGTATLTLTHRRSF